MSDRHSDTQLTLRLLRYVGNHRGLFALALALYPLTAATVVLPPYLVQVILDVIIPSRDEQGLYLYAGLYLAALVVEYGTAQASQFAMSVLGQRAMRTLRAQLFAHIQRLPARFYDVNPIGRILTRLTNDIEALAEVFATGAVTVLGDIISVVAVVLAMLWLDAKLTLVSFVVVPPLIVLTLVFRVYARRAFRDIRRRLAQINTFLAEHIGGMAVVQLFRQEQRTAGEFDAINRGYRDANHAAILFDSLLFAVVEAIGTAAVAAIIWFAADDLRAGAIGAGVLVAFIQYIRRFFIPIRDLSTKYTVIQSGLAAAERVFGLLDEPIAIRDAASARRLPALRHELALQNVWFAYQGGDTPEWVVRDLSLTVRAGEKIALVGATGSGKTTLLKLLHRSYDVDRGGVFVDGIDAREVALADLRRLFAVVLQDVYLFSGSVLDNLTLHGELAATAIHSAADAIGATPIINRLPHGFETQVRELGSNLSAGERQMLAFVRALARNPDVLMLDEATSNIDSETEARIQEALDVLLRQRTAIVVAHRLSTVRKVDRIVVLQHGTIAEEGTHDALLQRGGIYSRLAEAQLIR